MLNINIAVCDDDMTTLNSVSGAIKSIFTHRGAETTVYAFRSAKSLLSSSMGFALVFLDIDMPGTDGIACGKELRKRIDCPEIIYVSSREDRVFESFAVRPFGFVRKMRFLEDIENVITRYINSTSATDGNTSIGFTTHNGKINFKISSIEYIEGCGMYQQLHVAGQKEPIEIISRMEKLENSLSERGFMRIHKGYLVNYMYIGRLDGSDVTMQSGDVLPVSRRKSAEIKARYLALGRKYGTLMF